MGALAVVLIGLYIVITVCAGLICVGAMSTYPYTLTTTDETRIKRLYIVAVVVAIGAIVCMTLA